MYFIVGAGSAGFADPGKHLCRIAKKIRRPLVDLTAKKPTEVL
jgi:hypothetical protein